MNDKLISRLIIGVTIAIPVAVAVLHFLPKPDHVPDIITHCPLLNAILNGTCTVLLIASWIAIMKKKVILHKRLNVTAFVLSALFLLSYVAYHSFGKETLYPKDNPLRPLYLFILSSHIILAAVVLPLVLISFYRGLTNKVALHRKISKWTMPLWLYVTTTGVIVYLMISPYYSF
jgi:putative membrane protein